MLITEQGIQSRMQKYGVSRETAIAMLEEQLRLMPGKDSGASDVTNPESSMIKEETTKTLEDGTVYKSSISSPGMTPDALAKKALEEQQSAEQSNPQASQRPMQFAPSETFDVEDLYVNDVDPNGVPMGFAQAAEESVFDGSGGIGEIESGAPMQFAPQVSEMDEPSEGGMTEPLAVIEDEAPEIIPWISEFEAYVGTASEREAILASDSIVGRAKETGLDKVKPRAFKALTLALTSMMFGADAVDAFSTGLETVKQDYDAEAAYGAALAEKQNFLYEEGVKSDLKIREEAAKNSMEAPGKLKKSNNDILDKINTDMEGILQNLDLENWKGGMPRTALAHAMSILSKSYPEADLSDYDARAAFGDAAKRWMLSENPTTSNFAAFIKDEIVKKRLADESVFNLADFKQGSQTSEAYQKSNKDIFDKMMQAASLKFDGVSLGESGAAEIMKQEYTKFQKSNRFDAMVTEAGEAGMTPIMYYLSRIYRVNEAQLRKDYNK